MILSLIKTLFGTKNLCDIITISTTTLIAILMNFKPNRMHSLIDALITISTPIIYGDMLMNESIYKQITIKKPVSTFDIIRISQQLLIVFITIKMITIITIFIIFYANILYKYTISMIYKYIFNTFVYIQQTIIYVSTIIIATIHQTITAIIATTSIKRNFYDSDPIVMNVPIMDINIFMHNSGVHGKTIEK